MRKRSPSLKGLSATYLTRELNMTSDALYERQRALMRAGLLKSEEGWGPGSGVRATPHSVAMLLVAVLAADSLSEVAESTKRFALLKAEKGVCPITGKKTFGTALAAILASPRLSQHAHTITVHRGGALGPIAIIDWIMKEEGPSSWFVNREARKSRGRLDVRASLLGWPLQDLAGLISDSDSNEEPPERIANERQHHPTRKK
jgi:hypothetical protein